MELLLAQKGLTTYDRDDERTFYSDDMLKNNVIIHENTLINDDENDEDRVVTYISVKHFNDIDAGEWQMYWGELLAPIQVYRIVMDIYEMYCDYPLNLFLQMLDEISIGYTSSSMQSDQKRKDNIMKEIKDEIESLK